MNLLIVLILASPSQRSLHSDCLEISLFDSTPLHFIEIGTISFQISAETWTRSHFTGANVEELDLLISIYMGRAVHTTC